MKRPDTLAYWQLDLFMLIMIALLVLIMLANISTQWEIPVDAGWAVMTIGGMSLWVWAHWSALREEEPEQRAGRKQELSKADTLRARSLPLTPVQRQYLDVMRRHEHT